MWLLLPILFYSVIFLYVRHVYSYWKRKGFPSERVAFSWAFLRGVYRREFHHVDAIGEAYQLGKDRLLGIYCFFRPVLLVRNVQLARQIMDQSQGYFNECKWAYVRGYRRYNLLEQLAPIFNTERLTEMFYNMELVSNYMMRHLISRASKQEGVLELDLQPILRIYAINVIGNLAYGLDVNNFEQLDHLFNMYAIRALKSGNTQSFTLSHLARKSSLAYRLRDLIKSNIENREEGSVIRKDILQLLVKLRNGNELCTKSKTKWQVEHAYEHDKVLSIKRLAKLAEHLLDMSLDTIASSISLTLYEVLQEPIILEKLQAEVKDMGSQRLSYEQLTNLKYMDMCLKETLRKYPPLPIVERVCRKSYTLPNSRYTIGAGKTLMVPLLAIQRDEKHFSEPLKYKPLRFLHSQLNDNDTTGSNAEAAKQAFMGFGIGGAECVAKNFAQLVVKLALVKLLQHFHLELEPTVSEAIEVAYQPAPYIKSKDGLKVKIKMREIKSKYYL